MGTDARVESALAALAADPPEISLTPVTDTFDPDGVLMTDLEDQIGAPWHSGDAYAVVMEQVGTDDEDEPILSPVVKLLSPADANGVMVEQLLVACATRLESWIKQGEDTPSERLARALAHVGIALGALASDPFEGRELPQ